MTVKLALRMHEDSLCGRCGHSTRLSQSGDAQIAYRGESATCYACIAANLAAESGAGKTAYAVDLRDTPGAMDPDTADDIRWMPSDEDARMMGLTGKASGGAAGAVHYEGGPGCNDPQPEAHEGDGAAGLARV